MKVKAMMVVCVGALSLGLACSSPVQPTEPVFTEHDDECLALGMMTPFYPGMDLPFDGSVTWEAYGTDGYIYPGCASAWDKVTGGPRG